MSILLTGRKMDNIIRLTIKFVLSSRPKPKILQTNFDSQSRNPLHFFKALFSFITYTVSARETTSPSLWIASNFRTRQEFSNRLPTAKRAFKYRTVPRTTGQYQWCVTLQGSLSKSHSRPAVRW